MYTFMKLLILPPASLLLVAVAGLLAARRRFAAGWWVALAALGTLYLLSTPLASAALMAPLESATAPLPAKDDQALAESIRGAQAIVVLSAESEDAEEYGGPTVGTLTLVRLRYAARLHMRTGLPILVTGGATGDQGPSAGEEMRASLKTDFHTPTHWVEGQSRTTWENALLSAAILRPEGIQRVLVVTHAWHIPRAMRAFRQAGFDPIAAPTAFGSGNPWEPELAFLPSAKALLTSFYAIHELTGGLFYEAVHGRGDQA